MNSNTWSHFEKYEVDYSKFIDEYSDIEEYKKVIDMRK